VILLLYFYSLRLRVVVRLKLTAPCCPKYLRLKKLSLVWVVNGQ
jgi:hypothetical protein